jgi:hypothetical protein
MATGQSAVGCDVSWIGMGVALQGDGGERPRWCSKRSIAFSSSVELGRGFIVCEVISVLLIRWQLLR